jgi:Bacterial Ig-like domain (group 3)/Glycine rich protein/Fibronectin type III domain
VALGVAAPVAAAATTVTFSYTGSSQSWAVPAGVSSITVTADGAEGGVGSGGPAAGDGGSVTATIGVTAGETLTIDVGGQGTAGSSGGAGGFNGGGSGSTNGGGGGGASDVRQGGTALADRVVVAGGGGGSGAGSSARIAGAGGGTTGAAANGSAGPPDGDGGGGGTSSAGGASGSGAGGSGAAGGAGSSGSGGDGGTGATDGGGGGGGGGYFGGGGGGGGDTGGTGSGGGGGSSFTEGSATSVTNTQGGHTGNGQVTITYTAPATSSTASTSTTTASTTTLVSSNSSSDSGQPVTFTATVDGSAPTGTVLFQDGVQVIDGCYARPLAAGSATCTTDTLSVGGHSILAVYRGDAGNRASTSQALAQTVRATEPSAPTDVGVAIRDGRATVSFAAPASNGSAITGYTVTAEPGGIAATGTGSPIVVPGLTSGVAYAFSVTADNAVGVGPPSAAARATVADTEAPVPGIAIAALATTFARDGSLQIGWAPATDNVGVDHYELYRDGAPSLRLPGAAVRTSVHDFAPTGTTVYTIRALDAAGNESDVLARATVERVARPAAAPHRVPAWAWKLLRRQSAGMGARPAAPKRLPAWYRTWKAWRQHPFRLAD